jgi:hypothetical protein
MWMIGELWAIFAVTDDHEGSTKMNDNTKYGPDDRRYTVRQACERIGLGTTALYAAIRKGLIARKLGRRTYLFESDIQAYLQATPLVASSLHANENQSTAKGRAA